MTANQSHKASALVRRLENKSAARKKGSVRAGPGRAGPHRACYLFRLIPVRNNTSEHQPLALDKKNRKGSRGKSAQTGLLHCIMIITVAQVLRELVDRIAADDGGDGRSAAERKEKV